MLTLKNTPMNSILISLVGLHRIQLYKLIIYSFLFQVLLFCIQHFFQLNYNLEYVQIQVFFPIEYQYQLIITPILSNPHFQKKKIELPCTKHHSKAKIYNRCSQILRTCYCISLSFLLHTLLPLCFLFSIITLRISFCEML